MYRMLSDIYWMNSNLMTIDVGRILRDICIYKQLESQSSVVVGFLNINVIDETHDAHQETSNPQ